MDFEFWDAYNANLEKTGTYLIRGREIEKGLYHLVAEVVVMHTDGSFLAMRRDKNKPTYPSHWEISAGGAVLKDETPLQGAIRELREETGIVCNEMEKLYTITYENSHSIHIGYICKGDFDKEAITLQKGETSEYRWVEHEKVLDFIHYHHYVTTQAHRIVPYLVNMLDDSKKNLRRLIGCVVKVKVDRPIGTVHPNHPDICYPINYGYVENILAPDGEEQDAYIIGVKKPIDSFMGRITAVVKRNDDVENKWVVAPFGLDFTKSEIREMIDFQEKYFDIEIIA